MISKRHIQQYSVIDISLTRRTSPAGYLIAIRRNRTIQFNQYARVCESQIYFKRKIRNDNRISLIKFATFLFLFALHFRLNLRSTQNLIGYFTYLQFLPSSLLSIICQTKKMTILSDRCLFRILLKGTDFSSCIQHRRVPVPSTCYNPIYLICHNCSYALFFYFRNKFDIFIYLYTVLYLHRLILFFLFI